MRTAFISNLVSCLLSGFPAAVIILFVLKCFFKKQELLWKDLFLLSNCILLTTSLFYGICYFAELFTAWYSQVVYEQTAFRFRVQVPYWWCYWVFLLMPFIAPQLLWFKKLRKSYITSLLLVPFLSFGFLLERIMIMTTHYYRDSRPSGWTYHNPGIPEMLTPLLVFSSLLAVLYFLCRKKLPGAPAQTR